MDMGGREVSLPVAGQERVRTGTQRGNGKDVHESLALRMGDVGTLIDGVWVRVGRGEM